MDDKSTVFRVIGVDFAKCIDVKLVKCVLKITEIFNKKNIDYKLNEGLCEARNMLSFNVKINDKWKEFSTTYEFIEDCGDRLDVFEKVISDQLDSCLKD